MIDHVLFVFWCFSLFSVPFIFGLMFALHLKAKPKKTLKKK